MNQSDSQPNSVDQEFYRSLWSDLDESTGFPFTRPLLAHYSSVPILESILKNEEIWLSHPMLMNDHEELRWGFIEGRRLFNSHSGLATACRTSEAHSSLVESFNSYFGQFAQDHSKDVYVGCFCRHEPGDEDGLLSMWRAYGANGGGAALVFDTSKLTPSEGSPLILAPVEYGTTDDRLRWIETSLDRLADTIRKLDLDGDQMYRAAWAFFTRLKRFALFSKHKGFEEEREWRLVYHREEDEHNRYGGMLSYAITEKGIQPKLKLKVARAVYGNSFPSMEDLITSVLLGPTAGTYLAQVAVERMLEQLGKPKLAKVVVACSTPFRPA